MAGIVYYGGSVPFEVESLANTAGTFSGAVGTWTAVPFGAESPGRIICVMLVVGAGAARTLASATIGGVAATIIGAVSGPSGNSQGVFIYAVVPTGASGTVVATYSGTITAANLCIPFRIAGSTGAPIANADNDRTTGTGAFGGSIAIPTNGAMVAGTRTASTNTVTWTGATETEDTSGVSSAVYVATTAEPSHAFAVTQSTSGNQVVKAVSWGPA